MLFAFVFPLTLLRAGAWWPPGVGWFFLKLFGVVKLTFIVFHSAFFITSLTQPAFTPSLKGVLNCSI